MRMIVATTMLAIPVLLGCADSGLDTPSGRQGSDTSRAQTAELDAAFAAADELYKAGNYEVAFPEFQRLAEEGHAGAQYRLSRFYENALVVPRDREKAEAWVRKAARQGSWEAQLSLAYSLRYSRESYHWLRKAAKGGSKRAQEELGVPVCYGPEDWPGEWKPTAWVLDRAENGDPRAQAEMGQRYYFGEGYNHNESEALRWSLLAATAGELLAQYILGLIYTYGSDDIRDPHLAAGWLHRSAMQGYLPAIPHLGLAYLEGRGVRKDRVKAYMWFKIMSVRGLGWNADIPLAITAEGMTRAAIADGDRRFIDWLKTHTVICPGYRPLPPPPDPYGFPPIQPAPPPP